MAAMLNTASSAMSISLPPELLFDQPR